MVGCTNQAGEDARNVARHAALLGGACRSRPAALTVNRLCGSGLAAMLDTARAASCGQGELFIAGGVESMSRAPFVMAKAESAYSRDAKIFDSARSARAFPIRKIAKGFGQDTMAETADNVAREHGITPRGERPIRARLAREIRARQSGGLLRRGAAAGDACRARKKGAGRVVDQDEHPRPNTTLERLHGIEGAQRRRRGHGGQCLGHQ